MGEVYWGAGGEQRRGWEVERRRKVGEWWRCVWEVEGRVKQQERWGEVLGRRCRPAAMVARRCMSEILLAVMARRGVY